MNSWPDAAMMAFRSEKDTNWEGAFRVPAMIRWPGHLKPGTVVHDILGSHDWFPTLLAAAGNAGVTERLLQGWKIGDQAGFVYDLTAELTAPLRRQVEIKGRPAEGARLQSRGRHAS
jgi:arylsulfatase A-like enzyme